jgi:hypothetical protein
MILECGSVGTQGLGHSTANCGLRQIGFISRGNQVWLWLVSTKICLDHQKDLLFTLLRACRLQQGKRGGSGEEKRGGRQKRQGEETGLVESYKAHEREDHKTALNRSSLLSYKCLWFW